MEFYYYNSIDWVKLVGSVNGNVFAVNAISEVWIWQLSITNVLLSLLDTFYTGHSKIVLIWISNKF